MSAATGIRRRVVSCTVAHSPREASIRVHGDRNQEAHIVSRSGKQTHSPGEASISVRGDMNQEAHSSRTVANKRTRPERRRSGSAATGISRGR